MMGSRACVMDWFGSCCATVYVVCVGVKLEGLDAWGITRGGVGFLL